MPLYGPGHRKQRAAARASRIRGVSVAWDDADQRLLVLVNDEEQHSLWPSDKPIPEGWRRDGVEGTKDECMAHIDRVWTDMRPLSLRRALDAAS